MYEVVQILYKTALHNYRIIYLTNCKIVFVHYTELSQPYQSGKKTIY